MAEGLGMLEYVLDKGQEDDSSHSSLIVVCAVISGVALVSFVIWEWYQEHPVVEVKLFRNKDFLISNILMLVLGMALYGSTVLLPQYVQVWMGYSAMDAGMALSPGGFAVILLLPFVGKLVSKVDARYLIAFGSTFLSVSPPPITHPYS